MLSQQLPAIEAITPSIIAEQLNDEDNFIDIIESAGIDRDAIDQLYSALAPSAPPEGYTGYWLEHKYLDINFGFSFDIQEPDEYATNNQSIGIDLCNCMVGTQDIYSHLNAESKAILCGLICDLVESGEAF